MRYITAYYTDKGQRNSNQDSLVIKAMDHAGRKLILLAVADGVGGLELGELASGTVVNDLSKAFENLGTIDGELTRDRIISNIRSTLAASHDKINEYISKSGKQIASTVVLIAIYGDSYIAMNAGDSRLYRMHGSDLERVTEDDNCGGHVLTQCIGANQQLVPHIYEGELAAHMSFLLCSDGFYGLMEDSELRQLLESRDDKATLTTWLSAKGQELMARGERDNMTAVVFRVDEL